VKAIQWETRRNVLLMLDHVRKVKLHDGEIYMAIYVVLKLQQFHDGFDLQDRPFHHYVIMELITCRVFSTGKLLKSPTASELMRVSRD
jgi:hypothetical protein